MFDIKTPKRVYYLAADCEEDMTAWVDWVCQVLQRGNFLVKDLYPGTWGDMKRSKVYAFFLLFHVKVCGLRTFATEEDQEAREVCVEIIFLTSLISYFLFCTQPSK